MSYRKKCKGMEAALAVLLAGCMLIGCADQKGQEEGRKGSEEVGKETEEGRKDQEEGQEKEAGSTESELPEVGDFSERLSLKWYMCTDGAPYKDDNPVAKELSERFNVEMSTLPVNGFDNDKMNMTLAGGDVPDVLIRWGTQGYYDDGLTQSISKEMIQRYMPGTWGVLEELGDSAWNYATSATDGKIIGIPQISVTGNSVATGCIRQDWLDCLGLEMPTTIDEFTDVLRKFTFNDPDGNGKDDTYGLTIPGLHQNLLFCAAPMVFGAFGVNPSYWTLDENGEVSYGAVQTGYREALELLASWYEEGLIDPEWVVTDDAGWKNKVINGQVGFWSYANPAYMNYSNPTSVPSMTVANNPDAKLVYMKPVAGPDGKIGGVCDGPSGSWVMSFGAKASIEQIARAMQIAEEINMNPEVYTLTQFGIEGETFVRNEDGSAARLEGIVPAEYGCEVFRTASIFTWETAKIANPASVVDLMEESSSWPHYRNVVSVSAIKGTYDELEVDSAEMSKLTTEFFVSAITGTIDIDSEWEAYVQKWMELGGEAMTKGARSLPICWVNESQGTK